MKTFQLLLILCLVMSCKKDDDPVVYEENTELDSYIFRCKVNSLDYTFKDGINSYAVYSSTYGTSTSTTTNTTVIVTGSGVKNSGTANSGFVSFDNNSMSLSDYSANKGTSISGITSLGTHSYYQTGSSSAGISVKYVDENNVTWNSNGGPQDGTASFNVTGNTAGSAANSRRVKCTFSCKVYNTSGSSKTLTDGYCYGIFTAP